ncbi:MAG: hypothetical protein AB8B67_00475 [Rickettsiaceae bacterium]
MIRNNFIITSIIFFLSTNNVCANTQIDLEKNISSNQLQNSQKTTTNPYNTKSRNRHQAKSVVKNSANTTSKKSTEKPNKEKTEDNNFVGTIHTIEDAIENFIEDQKIIVEDDLTIPIEKKDLHENVKDIPIKPIEIKKQTNHKKKHLTKAEQIKIAAKKRAAIRAAKEAKIKKEFTKSELIIMLDKPDDVILDKITPKARGRLMDYSQYIAQFRKFYSIFINASQTQLTNEFINQYDNLFYNRKRQITEDELSTAINNAFFAASHKDLFALRAILDYYNTLQTLNANQNNLLNVAVINKDYFISKFLLLRGIDPGVFNLRNNTALDIAYNNREKQIIMLLNSAGVRY